MGPPFMQCNAERLRLADLVNFLDGMRLQPSPDIRYICQTLYMRLSAFELAQKDPKSRKRLGWCSDGVGTEICHLFVTTEKLVSSV